MLIISKAFTRRLLFFQISPFPLLYGDIFYLFLLLQQASLTLFKFKKCCIPKACHHKFSKALKMRWRQNRIFLIKPTVSYFDILNRRKVITYFIFNNNVINFFELAVSNPDCMYFERTSFTWWRRNDKSKFYSKIKVRFSRDGLSFYYKTFSK